MQILSSSAMIPILVYVLLLSTVLKNKSHLINAKRIFPKRVSQSLSPNNFSAKMLPSAAPKSSLVHIEPTTFGDGRFKASGNFIKFPKDIQGTIDRAKKEKKPLDIFAVYFDISGHTNLVGIPQLRVFAHTCVLSSSNVILSINAPYAARSLTGTAPTGAIPRRAPSGLNSGNIEILCNRITSSSPATIKFYMNGGTGRRGARGGPGRNGIDGRPGHRGRCKRKTIFGIRYKCKKERGHAGVYSTNGTNGIRGGSGGYGGNGGNLLITYKEMGTNSITFKSYNRMGRGGFGGSGGAAGRNGKYIPNLQYVTRCRSKCRENLAWESRPKLTTRQRGPPGFRGRNGRNGRFIKRPFFVRSSSSFSTDDFLRFAALVERYKNDIIIGQESCEEAMSIMDTVITIATYRRDVSLLQTMSKQASLSKKGVLIRKEIYGPATLSRAAPESIGKELSLELKYVKALKDQITSAELNSNVLSVLVTAAGISIPATNFNTLRTNLLLQRKTFQRAVEDIEARIENALGVISFEVEDRVLAKKDAAERAKKMALFKAVRSIVNIGVGLVKLDVISIFSSTEEIIGTIKNTKFTYESIKESFGKIGKLSKDFKELLSSATDIQKKLKTVKEGFSKAESTGCSFDDLKRLLVDAPDRIDKFPNLVDFDSSFAKIVDIGVVTDLSKALLQTRSSALTAQFSCVLGESLGKIPALNSAFDNYFTLSTSRLEILGRMVDIDIEIQQLSVQEQGIKAQKERLLELQKDIRGRTKAAALAILSVTFEYARMRAIETIERLTSSYGNLLLRDMRGTVEAYAKNRLNENGVLSFDASAQYANLVKLELDLKKDFRSCTDKRELPSHGFYSFDITPENSPELFFKKLRTGPNSRSSLVLDIHKNCAFYAGDIPPPRMLDNKDTRPACLPNLYTYNARMISISAELIGGDESLLPPGRSAVFAIIDQVGLQTFHAKPNVFKSYDMAPLQLPIGFVSLKKGNVSDITYHSTCFLDVRGLGGVNVDSPRVCPSPFSAYMLQIGHVEEPSLHPYLRTVKAIRIHTRLTAYINSETANICVT